MTTELATFASGCFWCTEAVFQQLRGVLSVMPGYISGSLENPDYRTVCTGSTGHAECVQIEFDPDVVSYHDLLDVFFKTHDPTTLNRQGADVGTQYRSGIFFHSEQQRELAEQYIRELDASGAFASSVVTEVTPASTFYPAEEYHRDYFNQNPGQGYCAAVIAPKVAKFQKEFRNRLASSKDA
ncbi:peptide-methionine (S)-S-oxide reductase MsrA [bacterium]|nr:peptide-methionine (S)-S-oxide reductase MsrA [bacterium]